MTSRARWIQPPDRWAPQSGQFSITCSARTCSTRWVGVMRGRAKPWRRWLSGLLLRWGLPARFRLEVGHPGRAARFGLAFQFGNPPLQPLNHPLLFQNGGLQLGDDGDKDSAVGGGEINFSIHDPVYDITTATRASLRQPAFGQFNSSSLNCYALLHYLTRHYPELSCLQIALCQLMPVNVPGVDQALELMVVSNAGDGGMGRSARILR